MQEMNIEDFEGAVRLILNEMVEKCAGEEMSLHDWLAELGDRIEKRMPESE